MKIIVCIKQVPDTTEIRLDPKTNTLIRDGVASIINPDDRSGIEIALRLKEQQDAHVTAVCMGPPQAEMALREALAMGCDEAVLITGREFGGSDTWATAVILAAGVRKLGFDLIITGRQAIDGDTAQVGPQLAEQLQIPQVSYVEELKFEDGALIVKRRYEEASQLIKVELPCLITALSELAIPRYMTVSGTVEAFKKEICELTFDDLQGSLDLDCIGLNGSPTRVVKSYAKQAKRAGTKLTDLTTGDAVAAIVAKLDEIHHI